MIWPRATGRQTRFAAVSMARGACASVPQGPREPRPGAVVETHRSCSRASVRILPGGMRESPCDGDLRGAILSGPSAPETFAGVARTPLEEAQAAVVRPVGSDV